MPDLARGENAIYTTATTCTCDLECGQDLEKVKGDAVIVLSPRKRNCPRNNISGRGVSGKIPRPLISRIAYYYNICDSRHHQCVSI